jgi:predicted peptidase
MVIFPQCPSNSYWSNVKRKVDKNGKPHFKFNCKKRSTAAMKLLVNFTDWLYNCELFNNQHFVVGGLSMGGMGTIELVRRRPNVFCAAFSICGGGKLKHPELLQCTRFWFFHGEKDDIVLPENSIQLNTQLTAAKIDSRINLYPQANHNSWDSTFSEPALAGWICTSKPLIIQEILILQGKP